MNDFFALRHVPQNFVSNQVFKNKCSHGLVGLAGQLKLHNDVKLYNKVVRQDRQYRKQGA